MLPYTLDENEPVPLKRRNLLFRFILAVFITIILLPPAAVLLLRWLPPPTSSFMIQKRIAHWRGQSKTGVSYHWVKWEEIPRHLPAAVMAAEDQKFLFHHGFDPEGIAAARERNKKSRRLRGGSTITQQTAKNLFLWPEKSYFRKGLEAYFTVLIEWMWPKRRIMHVYLNIAEFGDGIYGVGAAAEKLLKKPPRAITRSEAALLAAVLPSPKRLHVERPSPYVLQRVEWILGQMERMGDEAVRPLYKQPRRRR